MKKVFFILLLTFLLAVSMLFADDVEVNLDGNTSAHVFSVKDNAAATLMKVTGDGNVAITGSSKYLNFNSTQGATGYGFRDNAGTLEYKNSGGSWTPWTTPVTSPYGFPSSAYSYGQIVYNHGNYTTTQPTVLIGDATAYGTMLPADLNGGTPYYTVANGDVSIAYVDRGAGDGSLPAYIKINTAGTYRISATIALQGTSNTSIEAEIFRQNSVGVPTPASWITNTHDVEELSCAWSVTNNQYDSGTVSGILDCSANDYIALCSRVISGSASSQKVICVNLNVERIK